MGLSVRLGRRACFGAAAAWAAAAGSRALAAGAAAAPTSSTGPTPLVAVIQLPGTTTYSSALREQVDGYIASSFTSRHPGLAVRTVAAPSAVRTDLGYQSVVASVLAGAGPDVLAGSGYQFPAFVDAGALQPLGALASTLPMSAFAPGHIRALTRPPLGLAGLPAADGPDLVLVNLSALAGLGLPTPHPDWTYQAAGSLWRESTGSVRGTHRYGFAIDVEDYIAQLFGGTFIDASGTRCLADSPQVLRAMAFLVPLVQAKVASATPDPALADAPVRSGAAVMGMSPVGNLHVVLRDMTALGAHWDWLPMPSFPAGPLTFGESGWYGLNAYTSAPPEAARELIRFVVMDRGLRLLLYRQALQTPNQASGWADWVEVVTRVAPALKTKSLQYFGDAMSHAVCNRWFRYNPYEVDTVLHLWVGAVVAGQIAAAEGLRQAARAIDAMEEQGAAAGNGGTR